MRSGLLHFLLVPGLALSAADPADPSLLVHGDLESVEVGQTWPAGWPKPGPGATREAEGGNHFLRLTSAGPGAASQTWSIRVGSHAALRLSYRLRHAIDGEDKPWTTGFVFIECRDKSGKVVGPRPPVTFLKGISSEWGDVALPFAVPKGTTTLLITPTLYGSVGNTMDLDDLALVPCTAKEAQAHLKQVKAERPTSAPVEPEAEAPQRATWPPPLSIRGNTFIKDGQPFILTGVCVDGLQWSLTGEGSGYRALKAIEEWKANAIRLPFIETSWNGTTAEGKPNPKQTDGGAAYRAKIDAIITAAANRGVYVILDLHRFRAIHQDHVDAWKKIAETYRDHPAVLFEIFNEPHGISWEVWRDGGLVPLKKGMSDEDNFLPESEKVARGLAFHSPGMQAAVDAIRGTGATNVIIAGGVNYAGDLSGIADGFALTERGGNGIAYAWHQYWWHRGWAKTVLPVIDTHAVVVTECGASLDKMTFINPRDFAEPLGWSENFLGFLQEHRLSYTAFSFHPKCGPPAISDMEGTPTPAWGAFVKAALGGTRFALTAVR